MFIKSNKDTNKDVNKDGNKDANERRMPIKWQIKEPTEDLVFDPQNICYVQKITPISM